MNDDKMTMKGLRSNISMETPMFKLMVILFWIFIILVLIVVMLILITNSYENNKDVVDVSEPEMRLIGTQLYCESMELEFKGVEIVDDINSYDLEVNCGRNNFCKDFKIELSKTVNCVKECENSDCITYNDICKIYANGRIVYYYLDQEENWIQDEFINEPNLEIDIDYKYNPSFKRERIVLENYNNKYGDRIDVKISFYSCYEEEIFEGVIYRECGYAFGEPGEECSGADFINDITQSECDDFLGNGNLVAESCGGRVNRGWRYKYEL